MPWISSRLVQLISVIVVAFPLGGLAEEVPLLDKEEQEAVTYDPTSIEEDDFATEVEPIHEGALQGFNCMDKGGDGYLTRDELEHRGNCVERASERGMATDTRTALILTRMDADRDRRVSRREFNIWNEMQNQSQE